MSRWNIAFFFNHLGSQLKTTNSNARQMLRFHLHESQESVQDVNSQNKRFSCKAKEVGQTPEIFHLGIPLSRAQSVFILGRALDEAEPPLAGLEAALQLQVEVQLPEQPQRLAAHLRAGRAAAAAPGGADKGNRAPAPPRGAIPQRRGREPRAPGAPRRQGEGARFPSPHGRGWAPPRAPHPGRAARAPAGGRPRSPPRSESRRCPRHRHHPRPRGAAAAAAAAPGGADAAGCCP